MGSLSSALTDRSTDESGIARKVTRDRIDLSQRYSQHSVTLLGAFTPS